MVKRSGKINHTIIVQQLMYSAKSRRPEDFVTNNLYITDSLLFSLDLRPQYTHVYTHNLLSTRTIGRHTRASRETSRTTEVTRGFFFFFFCALRVGRDMMKILSAIVQRYLFLLGQQSDPFRYIFFFPFFFFSCSLYKQFVKIYSNVTQQLYKDTHISPT